MVRIAACLALTLVAAGCAAPAGSRQGPPIDIPVFAADDARVGKPGFVAETLRLNREDHGVRYTLMAFRVGDTWTLGAMVRGGDFTGEVHWRVGARQLRIPFSTTKPAAETKVIVEPPAAEAPAAEALVAQGASFRGTTWINVDLTKDWLADGDELQLQFVSTGGAVVTLPDSLYAGRCHSVQPTPR